MSATATNSQVGLSWTDNADNETGFQIERKSGNNGVWAVVGVVGPHVSTALAGTQPVTYSPFHVDAGLPAGTYYYRVRAYNNDGYSGYSNEASASTALAVPAAPSNLTVVANTTTEATLMWSDNSSNEGGFALEERTAGDTNWFKRPSGIDANSTSHTVTQLSSGWTYYFRIRAYNGNGYSAYSNVASVTPVAPVAAPTNLTAVADPTSARITLTWQDNSSNESQFFIERKIGSSGTWVRLPNQNANTTQYVDAGLAAGTYYYRVWADDGRYVSSGYSNEASATTIVADPLGAPKAAYCTASQSDSVYVAWSDFSDGETGFKLERKTGASGTWAQIAVTDANRSDFRNDSPLV